ncbi:haloacid dehalogenase [Parapedobacter lycopersici]|uniref:haloacid dehalogenase n=1 Tax=Parapedobacter lycopersici TaxID=1864939 RepID=UPI00214DB681|nr:haloacid dehalogenase [Parapedobacter lycopersici]
MLTYPDIDEGKKAVIFGLDDVLFPKKDYLLQVYYLFAHLLEYMETVPPAKDLTDFLKTAYEHHGESGLFNRAADAFGIDPKYRENFDRLHIAAKLPLKLLLYQPMLDLMQALNGDGKQVFILTPDNPAMQLNKLKHLEWNGLDRSLKVYFQEELKAKRLHPLHFLLTDNGLHASDAVCIGAGNWNTALPNGGEIDLIDAARFVHPSGSQKIDTP